MPLPRAKVEVESEDYESSLDSESNDEAFEFEDDPDPTRSLVQDAQTTIAHHSHISNANALALNQKMQEHLHALKNHLEALLRQCRMKYHANSERMTQKMEKSTLNQGTRKHSFVFLGYPFFKNHQLISARPNNDFLYRKNHLKEYFPMDMTAVAPFWMTLDKVFLINGVRHQVIEHLVLQFKTAKRKNIPNSSSENDRKAAMRSLHASAGEFLKRLKQKRLFELMSQVKDMTSLRLDWYSISMKNLDGRHKPNACEAIWNAFLHPLLNRQQWTAEEDDRLLNELDSCVPVDWRKIADRMPQRSLFQCVVQFRTKLYTSHMNCGRWSAEEDATLMDMVEKYRTGDVIPWNMLVERMPQRNKKQIYQRYIHTLKPDLLRNKFSPEEDCKIMACFKEFGLQFSMYKELLPDRTTLQIRNRYNNVLQHVGKAKNWSVADDAALMEHVAECGTSDWAACARKLVHHTRTSCRSRYTAIMKHKSKNPNCLLEDIPRRRVLFSSDVTPENCQEKIEEAMQAPAKRSKDAHPSLDPGLQSYLKYSYSYDMKAVREGSSDDPITNHTYTVCQMLKSEMCPLNYRLLNALSDASIDMMCLEEPEYSAYTPMVAPDPPLPTNWNTALVLRGLSIMFPSELTAAERQEVRTTVVHPALDLFRQRFRSLLTNTAMASKLSLLAPATSGSATPTEAPIPDEIPPESSNAKRKLPRTYGPRKKKENIALPNTR